VVWRLLQVLALLALMSTAHLVFQASPAGPSGQWQIGRLMYAGAGAVGALTLLAVGGLGANLARLRRQLDRIEARLEATPAATPAAPPPAQPWAG
jgi:uncharacterized small protein (DUF1192 family)